MFQIFQCSRLTYSVQVDDDFWRENSNESLSFSNTVLHRKHKSMDIRLTEVWIENSFPIQKAGGDDECLQNLIQQPCF